MSVITQAMREYGQAIRGDWRDHDGRSVILRLDFIADAIDKGDDRDVSWWRNKLGVCPDGGGHWSGSWAGYCETDEGCPSLREGPAQPDETWLGNIQKAVEVPIYQDTVLAMQRFSPSPNTWSLYEVQDGEKKYTVSRRSPLVWYVVNHKGTEIKQNSAIHRRVVAAVQTAIYIGYIQEARHLRGDR